MSASPSSSRRASPSQGRVQKPSSRQSGTRRVLRDSPAARVKAPRSPSPRSPSVRAALGAKKGAAPQKLSDFQDKIRGAGLRSTAPRVAVLRELESATAPLSHADLVDALGNAGYDRVTIYRNLTDLTEAGLVVRADLGDHVWRFELRRSGKAHQGHHPHFTCTDCGTVSCLPEESVRITSARGAPKAIAARAVEVHLRGLCDRCD